jgi:plastocyanin
VRRLLPLTALAALALAGCGGDDDKPGRSVTVEAGASVHVVADEYTFDPEAITVTGGRHVRVELENRGVLAHNLRVFDGGTEVGGTDTFTGGKTRGATLRLATGDYELVCTVGNHADLGMRGKLTVR